MRLRGIIFDFDGTIANTIPVCCAAFREVMLARLGREYGDAEIVALFGPSEEGIFQRVAGDDCEACLEDYLGAYAREHAACAAPFPGVPELLDLLGARGVAVALVTGKGARSAAISLGALGLAEAFEIVETGSAAGSVKPAAIRRVVARWGVPAASVVYVGDAPQDVVEAREAGVIPLAAAWAPTADRDALAARGPAALFESVDAFTDWVAGRV